MLAIRLQRLGRKGLPVYRVAVQEAQRHPSSGRVVAYVGSYNPHTKQTTLNKEKVEFYLKNGAQPTPRVVKILSEEKIALPDWVKQSDGKKNRAIRNPEKLRKNRPAEEAAAEEEAPEEAPAAEAAEQTEAPEENTSAAEESSEDTKES
jgi:small subunit ribosomal protein S16